MGGGGFYVWGSSSLAMAFLTVTKGRERGGGGDAQEEGVIIAPACLGSSS